MAPSATTEIAASISKVAKGTEKPAQAVDDKTPLEAISHGPLIHPGMNLMSFLNCIPNQYSVLWLSSDSSPTIEETKVFMSKASKLLSGSFL